MSTSDPRTRFTQPLHVFVSYARNDAMLKEMFDLNLRVLVQQGWITTWTDKDLGGGEVWNQVIEDEMKAADIILFLVSNSFLASDFIRRYEIPLALEQVSAGNAVIVPVILKPCGWEEEKWAGLQALPSRVKAVTQREEKDWETGFSEVEMGLRDVIKRLLRKKQAKPTPALQENRTRETSGAGEAAHTGGTPPPHHDYPHISRTAPAPSRRLPIAWLGVACAVILIGSWFVFQKIAAPLESPIRDHKIGHDDKRDPSPADWALPAKDTKIQLLNADGQPLESSPVDGVRSTAWVPDGTGAEIPYFRFYFGYKGGAEDLSGPLGFRVYALHARFDSEPPFDGKELVFDRTYEPKQVKLPQGEVLEYSRSDGWLPATGVIAKNTIVPVTPTSFCALGSGAKGSFPAGEHEIGVVVERAGEAIYRQKIKVKVTDDWVLPEKYSGIRVLSMNDQPIEGQVIPAKREASFKSLDVNNVASDYPNGVSFCAKFQSKGAEIPGPLIIQYYFQAAQVPAPPTGQATMSLAWPLFQKPLRQGYTAAVPWLAKELIETPALGAGATKVVADLHFNADARSAGLGIIPAGIHQVGVEVIGTDTFVLYRNVWKIEVKDAPVAAAP